MPVIDSKLDLRSEQYARNRDEMLEALGELDVLFAAGRAGGGEEAMARLRKRGKMPLRERIALVLDPDTPFLEISPLAGLGLRTSRRRRASSSASASIAGVECVIIGHDPTVRARRDQRRSPARS